MSEYSNLIVYYFSGTGNSANVAQWVAQTAIQHGVKAEVIDVAHHNRISIVPIPKETIICFCSPVHGFNYPPVMQAFIRRFPKGNNGVMLMNTRAGMLIGKWITPGLSGITFYLSAILLLLKGYKIKAMFPVDLPSNWISVHPGLNNSTIRFLHERNKVRVSAFASRIFSGGVDFSSFREIVQDLVVSPISVGYYFVGRFLFAKTYFASSACNNCNLCIAQCPVKAIKVVDNRPFWTFRCESCMHCMSYCPQKAIETAHGPIVAFMLVFSLVIWSAISFRFGLFIHLENGIIGFVVQSGLLLALLSIWYRILHFMLHYRWFNKIVTYSSLTFYKFWGNRYKALRERK